MSDSRYQLGFSNLSHRRKWLIGILAILLICGLVIVSFAPSSKEHPDPGHSYRPWSESTASNATAVIPAYDGHYPLLPIIVGQLANQTYVPDRVILAVSGGNRADVDEAIAPFRGLFRIDVVYVPERRNAAENRNAAFKLIGSSEIVFLFDADDLYHQRRVEIGMWVFRGNPNANILVHGYTSAAISLGDGIYNPDLFPPGTLELTVYDWSWPGLYLQEDGTINNNRAQLGTPIFRGAALVDNPSLRYNTDLNQQEDADFDHRLCDTLGGCMQVPNKDMMVYGPTIPLSVPIRFSWRYCHDTLLSSKTRLAVLKDENACHDMQKFICETFTERPSMVYVGDPELYCWWWAEAVAAKVIPIGKLNTTETPAFIHSPTAVCRMKGDILAKCNCGCTELVYC